MTLWSAGDDTRPPQGMQRVGNVVSGNLPKRTLLQQAYGCGDQLVILGSIRPSEIQTWVRRLKQDLAPSTIGVVDSFVAGIFRSAVRDRLLAVSPRVDVRLPRPEPKRVEPLATDRVEALIAAMPDRYRALVVVAAGTGLRHGEALGLEVETVDFLRRTLGVRQQLVTMPGRPPYLAPPKTPSSHRTVPLPQVVVDALAAHLAAFPGRRGRAPGHRRQAGPQATSGPAGVHRRRSPDPPDPVLDHLAAYGSRSRAP